LIDGGDDGVVVVGKEFTVVGAEVMVRVASHWRVAVAVGWSRLKAEARMAELGREGVGGA
jgi:hypothetical protein